MDLGHVHNDSAAFLCTYERDMLGHVEKRVEPGITLE